MNYPSDPRMAAYFNFAHQRIQAGFAEPMIVNELVHQGLSPTQAKYIIANVKKGRAKDPDAHINRMNGIGHMVLGALCCFGGILAFVFWWDTIGQARKGRYLVFAAVFGGLGWFILGLVQAITGKDQNPGDG